MFKIKSALLAAVLAAIVAPAWAGGMYDPMLDYAKKVREANPDAVFGRIDQAFKPFVRKDNEAAGTISAPRPSPVLRVKSAKRKPVTGGAVVTLNRLASGNATPALVRCDNRDTLVAIINEYGERNLHLKDGCDLASGLGSAQISHEIGRAFFPARTNFSQLREAACWSMVEATEGGRKVYLALGKNFPTREICETKVLAFNSKHS